ncbi:MAG: hypothetical protein OEV43_09320 [Coriobacteriia bacterium]|nr:hypothetical protein [Coriobacteriia bacterium]
MHEAVSVGWFGWVFLGIIGLLIVGALFVILNASRRPLGDFGRGGPWPWIVGQGVFLVALTYSRLFGAGLTVVRLVFTTMLFAFVQQITYLLRIVYPTPGRLAARESDSDSAAQVPEEHS